MGHDDLGLEALREMHGLLERFIGVGTAVQTYEHAGEH
jgi:hypothetical protein